MDFAKMARNLADEVLPPGTSVKQTLAFIEKVAGKLEVLYEVGRREGLADGKVQEKRRASEHGSCSHSSWCSSEDCLGQCMVR